MKCPRCQHENLPSMKVCRGALDAPVEFADGASNQDFFDVCGMKALRSGRSALLPHLGHSILPFSCWLIIKVTVISRSHLSQWYSYMGMADSPS